MHRNIKRVLSVLFAVLAMSFSGIASAVTLSFSAPDGRVEAGSGMKATLSLPLPTTKPIELSVKSSHPSVATVPSRVTIAQRSSRVAFTINTAKGLSSDTTVTITVDTVPSNPKVPPVKGTLRVLREAQVSSITFEPAQVTSGQAATGKVTLSRAAAVGGVSVPLQSPDASILRLPASVSVSAGSTFTNFKVIAPTVTQPRNIAVQAPLGGIVPFGVLRVEPAPLEITALMLPAEVVSEGPAGQGRITLNRPVNTTFSDPITLSSDNANVTVNASVVGRSGNTVITFPITVRNIPAGAPSVPFKIRANLGTSVKSATSNAVGRQVVVDRIAVPPTQSVVSGQDPKEGQVYLNIASLEPLEVLLTSSSPNLEVPATVKVPANQIMATFPVIGTGLATGAPSVTAALGARLEGGTQRTVNVSVRSPDALVARVEAPATILSDGPPQSGRVTLEGPSQSVTSVALRSNFQQLSVPTSVAIPAGQTVGTFALSASGLAEGMRPISATISASTPVPGSAVRTATVSVTAPPPSITIRELAFSPAGPLSAPSSTTGTVTLSAPAPAGGTSVFIGVVQGHSFTSVSPNSVTVAAGATTARFQVNVTTDIRSDASGTPMDAGLGCISTRIGAQTGVRACISVGK